MLESDGAVSRTRTPTLTNNPWPESGSVPALATLRESSPSIICQVGAIQGPASVMAPSLVTPTMPMKVESKEMTNW